MMTDQPGPPQSQMLYQQHGRGGGVGWFPNPSAKFKFLEIYIIKLSKNVPQTPAGNSNNFLDPHMQEFI